MWGLKNYKRHSGPLKWVSRKPFRGDDGCFTAHKMGLKHFYQILESPLDGTEKLMEILQAFLECFFLRIFAWGWWMFKGPPGGTEGIFQILEAHWAELKKCWKSFKPFGTVFFWVFCVFEELKHFFKSFRTHWVKLKDWWKSFKLFGVGFFRALSWG